MSNVTEILKRNPLQTITVGIAITGVVFSIFNFYLLANISPLTKRVDAIEVRNEKVDPLIPEFITVKEKVDSIEKGITELKSGQIRLENKIDRIVEQ